MIKKTLPRQAVFSTELRKFELEKGLVFQYIGEMNATV